MIHVIEEANRCLQCKKPMCTTGCPISTNIPTMIRLFKEGKVKDAGQMLFENNPLSVVCSLVCDHKKQCEGHCVLARRGQGIHISSIENYISNAVLDTLEVPMAPKNGKMVAVIGAGPAGITIAIEMAKKGYSVTIFDSKDKIGGVLQYGIPDFRLPKTILARYKKKLEAMGILVRPNTTIGGALVIDDLFRDGYKAIFIGTGVWRPKKLAVPGESLGNVHFAIDFLANPSAYNLGEDIAIIGAGNTAMDVARTILRSGHHNVTIYARRNKIDASEEEKDYATVLAGAPAHAYSGQCTYCGHCAPCPAGIDIAMVNKLLDLALMQPEVPATVRAHYEGLSANGSDCIACGGCERRCPFGVKAMERMKQAEKVFG